MSDLKGKVHEVIPAQQVSDKLKKQEVIIEYVENNPQYPEYLKFEAINDKCDLIVPLKVGQEVEVFFNMRGRAWTDKSGKKSYFNSMQLWKVNVLSGASEPTYAPPAELSSKSEEDDLPF